MQVLACNNTVVTPHPHCSPDLFGVKVTDLDPSFRMLYHGHKNPFNSGADAHQANPYSRRLWWHLLLTHYCVALRL